MKANSLRNDWTPDEDLMLTENILSSLRRGETITKGFENAVEQINITFNNNRTTGAAGFRWHNHVKQDYTKAIELAKQQGKKAKRSATVQVHKEQQKSDIDKVDEVDEVENFISQVETNEVEEIQFENKQTPKVEDKVEEQKSEKPIETGVEAALNHLSSLQEFINSVAQLKSKIEVLKAENAVLTSKNSELEKINSRLEKENAEIKEDYAAVLSVIDKARQLTVQEDSPIQSKSQSSTFKMDRNGNLSRL